MVRSDDWEIELDDAEVLAYIESDVGEGGLAMARFLAANEPIGSVEILEAHEEVKPADVRKVLYRLMDAHVAEYEKDTDAKGWETFTWHLTMDGVKHALLRRWEEARQDLKKQIRFQKDHEFYACPDEHQQVPFESAMEINFHCPMCQAPMDRISNKDNVTDLEARLAALDPDTA